MRPPAIPGLEDETAAETPDVGPVGTWPVLERVARQWPQRVCVEDGAGQVTLGQLADRVEEIGRALDAEQPAGRIVAVFLDRDRDLIAGLFAVHRAGAAYLPVITAQPDARIRVMLDDARPSCVITSRALADRVPADQRVLLLDDLTWHGPRPAATQLPAGCAYLMYTSGSTGRPKGVLVGHAQLNNLFSALDEEFAEPARQVWLAQCSEGYDVSVPEVLWAPSRGHHVCISGSDPLSIMFSALASGTRDGRSVTHLLATPSLARLLVEHPQAAEGLRRLHTLVLAGEPFPTDLAPRLAGDGLLRLLNRYGPTEATVWVAGATYAGPDDPATQLRAVTPHTVLRVLDAELREVAAGETGHLFIGGAQVAIGYHNRGDLNDDRFISDPWGAPGDRLYDSGDLARREADGSFTVIGRDDDQVKISGHRVELGEIEAIIRGCPGVRDAVCVPDAAPLASAISALVSVSEPRTGEDIRAWVRDRLPRHMVPSRIEVDDQLPLTASGKVDRVRAAALLRPGRAAAVPPAE